MNPVSLVVWVLAPEFPVVVLSAAALVLVVVTLALHDWRHPQ